MHPPVRLTVPILVLLMVFRLGEGENKAPPPPPPPPSPPARRVGRRARYPLPGLRQRLRGREPLSLLAFNLEPLTDTLEELDLSANNFRALPRQLRGREFPRLRRLDLSHNDLGGETQVWKASIFPTYEFAELPPNAFSGMSALEDLGLEHSGLTSLALELDTGEEPLPSLRRLRLSGNPLRCDCSARWLWRTVNRRSAVEGLRVELPTCAAPFAVRDADLKEMTGNKVTFIRRAKV